MNFALRETAKELFFFIGFFALVFIALDGSARESAIPIHHHTHPAASRVNSAHHR